MLIASIKKNILYLKGYSKKKKDAKESAFGTGVTCGGETGLCGTTGCGTTGWFGGGTGCGTTCGGTR
jgi:hypothetical protein